jgi:hypothetical protein
MLIIRPVTMGPAGAVIPGDGPRMVSASLAVTMSPAAAFAASMGVTKTSFNGTTQVGGSRAGCGCFGTVSGAGWQFENLASHSVSLLSRSRSRIATALGTRVPSPSDG